MEETCPKLQGTHIALFSDNSPTVSWVSRMAAKHSNVAMRLLRALALRLQLARTSPLTPLHIPGIDNTMADLLSQSFGSEPKWHCRSDNELTHLLSSLFPPPSQASWTLFHLSSKICTKVISTLQTPGSTTWRRLPQRGKYGGNIGPPTSHLWEWTLSFNTRLIPCRSEHSPDLPPESTLGTTAEAAKLQLVPRIAQMLKGFKKDDPPTLKKLPVEINIPAEYISLCSLRPTATEIDKATADLILIAFYFLLRVGEYTIKDTKPNARQTVQF